MLAALGERRPGRIADSAMVQPEQPRYRTFPFTPSWARLWQTTVEWAGEPMLMPTTHARPGRLTYRDFVKFPDDGKRHELIDGVHYVTPSPASAHQRVVGNLHFLIRLHLEQHGGGEVFLSPFDVLFTTFDIVEPDLLFVSDARKHVVTEQHVEGSPDLVVEVRSPSTRRRDEGVKLKLYTGST